MGKQRGAGRHQQESWGWREGFSPGLASSLLPAARDGPLVSGEFKLGYSHSHSLNITFIF